MDPTVETSHGRLVGVQEERLQAFRGIPFAAPPLGERRFRAPEPPAPWSGVREARLHAASAPQPKVEFDLIRGLDVGAQSEDCLYLNVYTPAADGAKRPVMVWIHGGAFTIGSGSQALYDTRPLVRRGDVVVVNVNYRLGALGFLQLDGRFGATANAGILDQVAALSWVRDNIAAFGGDPSRVTIFGESAGGHSVGTLLGMPCAQGLFRGAIAQSGAAHAARPLEEAERVTAIFLAELGLGPADQEKLWEQPVEALLEAQRGTSRRLQAEPLVRDFSPVIDGGSLPESPVAAIAGGLSREVAVLAGATRDEWKLFGFLDPGSRKLDRAGLLERIEARAPGRGRRIVDAYIEARGAGSSASELFFAIETDRVFRIPSVRLAESQAAHQERTYAYLVTWEAAILDGALGACHGVDVPFVLGAIGSRGAEAFVGAGPAAERLSDQMMEAWLAFATTGDPNHPDLPDWPTYEERRRATMFLGRECRVVDAPLEIERRAWDGVL